VLDLKAKLAAAGLVSEADVKRAEAEKRAKAERRSGKPGARGGKPTSAPPRPQGLAVASLRGKNKGEIYDAVRRFVERVRLDPAVGEPSETAQPFHFPTPAGRIGRVVIEPELASQLEDGRAALVAFMSNHGIAHAVVPAEHGLQIAEVMPKWLRVLAGDERAGLIDKPESELASSPAPAAETPDVPPS
jgi:uncharacterized protein YaiL (DUF2058 family)